MSVKTMIDIPEVIKRANAHGLQINMDDSPNAVVRMLLDHLDNQKVNEEVIPW